MKIVYIFIHPSISQSKIQYVLNNINFHPFCKRAINFRLTHEQALADMFYGPIETYQVNTYQMIANQCILTNEIKLFDLKSLVFPYAATKLHFIGHNSSNQLKLQEKKLINGDIFETLFFHWSRYEEVHWPLEKRDQWDLMPELDLHVVKNGMYTSPFLDDLILWLIRLFLPDFQFVYNKQFIYTYDIDYLHFDELSYRNMIGEILSILKRSNHPFQGISKFIKFIKEPQINFDALFPSNTGIVFLLMGGSHAFDYPKTPNAYKRIDHLVQYVVQLGMDLGIHPSFETTYGVEKMYNELHLLEKISGYKITKSRQHFLHIDYDKTIPLLEQCGIEEDYSCGFNLYTGYKVGTSFPFYYWNWQYNRPSTIISYPLIWMDSAQWYQSKKQINTYNEEKTKFFKSITYGETQVNEHPLFQTKLKYLL